MGFAIKSLIGTLATVSEVVNILCVTATIQNLSTAQLFFLCIVFLGFFPTSCPSSSPPQSLCTFHTPAAMWYLAPWCCCWGLAPTNSCNESRTLGRETQTFPQDSSLINEPGLGQIAEQDDADSQSWG